LFLSASLSTLEPRLLGTALFRSVLAFEIFALSVARRLLSWRLGEGLRRGS
jgi:hypothetical protein